MAKIKYKNLINTYNKVLKTNFKNNLNFNETLEYFITKLRLMRDMSILNTDIENLENDVLVTSLCITISEYNKYKNCINNYYKIINNIAEQIDKTKTQEEVQADFQREKSFHLNLFWNLVRTNMESWLEAYDYKI